MPEQAHLRLRAWVHAVATGREEHANELCANIISQPRQLILLVMNYINCQTLILVVAIAFKHATRSDSLTNPLGFTLHTILSTMNQVNILDAF